MDFFRSVFAEDPSPPSSPQAASSAADDDQTDNSETTPLSPSNSQSQNPNPSPQISSPTTTTSWATFGSSLFKSVASKSESVFRNYRSDLEEFSSGLRKETAVIREAARRAVENLPGRLESGAAVAQTSLESVGQVIDDLGGAVSGIIVHGKDSIFQPNDGDGDASDAELAESGDGSDVNKQNLKPYSRIDALISAVQCDIKTYCEEPEEAGEYAEWKKGFLIDEKVREIEDLVDENGVIGEIYDEVVPGKVDRETFWSRYFFRVHRVKRAEEARVELVRRAIGGEDEEELSWDVDDEDDEGGDNEFKPREEMKKEPEEETDEIEKGPDGGEKKRSSVSEDSVEGRLEDGRSDRESSVGKNDISDFSIVSSQRSSHEEEEIGWDEIEDLGSDNEDSKVASRGSTGNVDLPKPATAAEEEEQLPWDIEDDDGEPAKL